MNLFYANHIQQMDGRCHPKKFLLVTHDSPKCSKASVSNWPGQFCSLTIYDDVDDVWNSPVHARDVDTNLTTTS